MSPVLLVTALLLRLEDGGTALFRLARGGEAFTVLTFGITRAGSANVRSAQGVVFPVPPPRFGRFIRRTNIDELPQLSNVFLGDMIVVGARPLSPAQEGLVAARPANRALALRPRLAGLA